MDEDYTVLPSIKYCVHETDTFVMVLGASWGGQAADPSGYGKAPAPSRGGLANYRTRPY